jgi:hypothetical protein
MRSERIWRGVEDIGTTSDALFTPIVPWCTPAPVIEEPRSCATISFAARLRVPRPGLRQLSGSQ